VRSLARVYWHSSLPVADSPTFRTPEDGSWYASPATHFGYELVAAGMLIMAAGHDGKPLDYDTLERWTQVGF
jgi:hypothetical protein